MTSGTIKGDSLQKLTKMCITKLENIGLNVRAIVCDQGTNNRNFLETLENVTIQNPYCIHNDKKVYVFYDPSHLLKNVRNNLKKGNLLYDNEVIRLQYITDVYNMDKTMSIRMAPKLTGRHIELSPFSNMRVNLAAQVLSHSVAAGMNTLTTLKIFPPDASAITEFVETFN